MSSSPTDLSVDVAMRDDPELAVAASGLGKCYRMFNSPAARLKQAFSRRELGTPFWALQDVSFTVRRGEALGVVGHNGAGKSTLLQILAGSLRPTTGEARLRGRVTSLLELGSGFLPDFTGRENVFVNGTALGLSTRELERRLDEIRAFAEIGDFFDQPVKTYSSGMYVRLAFAVQACLDPDILIVDEALAVGDIFFQQKCHAHMKRLLDDGVAILLVTHDVQAVRKYCSEVLLLENGKVAHQGDVEVGIQQYMHSNSKKITKRFDKLFVDQKSMGESNCIDYHINHSSSFDFWPKEECFIALDHATRIEHTNNTVYVSKMAVCDIHGRPSVVFEQQEQAVFYIEIVPLRDTEQLAVSLMLKTRDNIPLYCESSLLADKTMPCRNKQGSKIRFRWEIELPLARGEYTFSLGIAEYPHWASGELETISPETFFSLGDSLLNIENIGIIYISAPRVGVKSPFLGLVDLGTKVQTKIIEEEA